MFEVQIRQEVSKDYDEIRELVALAFATAEHSDGNEHLLVDKLRTSTGFVEQLSLVAVSQEKILGHILFTEVKVGESVGLALAPLSVLPEAQGKAVGTALVETAHDIAKTLGYEFSVVLGSETYYPRFGYVKASLFEILPPFDVPEENFMLCFLVNPSQTVQGTVIYVKEMLGS